MTILALSESKNIAKKSLVEKTISDRPSYMNTMKALSNLINVTTSELESANFELDQSAKKATELKNFTSAIFDSQSNITIVSSKKEKNMIDANAAFFSFFRFKNVDDFVKKY